MYNQGEVDALAGCTAFNSNLYIASAYGEITSLDALSDLTYINGGIRLTYNAHSARFAFTVTSLSIFSTIHMNPAKAKVIIEGIENLESLDGLEHVQQVSEISLVNNAKLRNLRGLRNVRGSVDMVTILSCPLVQSFEYLGGITDVLSKVLVLGSPVVVSALGFHNIPQTSAAQIRIDIGDKSCGSGAVDRLYYYNPLTWDTMACVHENLVGSFGYPDCLGGIIETAAELASYGGCTAIQTALHIRNIDATLANFSALAHLTAINGQNGFAESLVVEGVAHLSNFSTTFSSLQGKLSGAVHIRGNADLVSLDGLQGLSEVGGTETRSGESRSVTVVENPKLVSIRGLDGLRGALPGKLLIKENPLLQPSSFGALTGVEGANSVFVTTGLTTCYSYACL
eukprot:g2385.t1